MLALSLSLHSVANAQTDSVEQTKFFSLWADEITDRSAFLYAHIAYPSPKSIGWFEWGDSATFGHVTSHLEFQQDAGNEYITYELTDLSPQDTIYARAILENSAGRVESNVRRIITKSRMYVGGASITSVSEISPRSAVIHAEFDAEMDQRILVGYEYSRARWQRHWFSPPERTYQAGHVSLTEKITGLIPATTYTLRLNVRSTAAEGNVYSKPFIFTTAADSIEHGFVLPFSFLPSDGWFHVRFWGVHTLATNCSDELFDEGTLPPLPPDPVFEPRFTNYTSNMRECYDLGTYVDVRRFSLPTQIDTFKLKFGAGSEFFPIRVSWPSLHDYYDGPVMLKAGLDTIDMKKQNSFLISNDYIGTVTIYASSPTEFGKLIQQPGNPSPASGPMELSLEQNYPNPFNPSTLIRFTLTRQARVMITIYNILGETIAIPLDEVRDAGSGSIAWDATNVPAGVYFYAITVGSFSEVRKMVVVK